MFVEISKEAFEALKGLDVKSTDLTESDSLVIYQYFDRYNSLLVEAFHIDSEQTHYWIGNR